MYPKHVARSNCNFSAYLDIAIKHYQQAKNMFIILKTIDNTERDPSSEHQMYDEIYISIVFSSMAVESFLNDYAATCLDDDFFYDNFDKLSVISKFCLISNFILNVKVDKAKSYYFLLKELERERNLLVHNKSKSASHLGYTKDEYLEIKKQKEEGLLPEYLQINLIEIKKDLLKAFKGIKCLYEITLFFDKYDINIWANKRLFRPDCKGNDIDYNDICNELQSK
ncbi:MAG: hypothetical protein CVU97_05900 [Firmicutes bacterium HGW-Firmicutes-21]|nr:MAG: hypothetical protein CVU97_05900 [Firmicutes bacterium HGW-Firmicutes-21]